MKKLGFGLMRLPVTDGTQEHIDQNALNQMVDLYFIFSISRKNTFSVIPVMSAASLMVSFPARINLLKATISP